MVIPAIFSQECHKDQYLNLSSSYFTKMICQPVYLLPSICANDVILYREINTADDVLILQEDLSIIARWAQDWLNVLNMCEHLTITTKRIKHCINLLKQNIFNQTLSWRDHINNISSKANSTRGFLQRNLRNCSPHIKARVLYIC